jgi:glucokinase
LPASSFFAVDVGGSSVKSGLVVDGRVDGQAREPVASDLDGLVTQLMRLADGREWGLCVPGLIEEGLVRKAANLPLNDTRLTDLLDPPPKVFVNDVVAATVGEAAGGTLALLQVGTGIAGRCAVDGRVVARPHAGEVGHLRFRDEGLPCRCGNRGCVEAYGAWGGILDRYASEGRPEPTPASVLEDAVILDDALEAISFAAAALVAAWDPGTLRLGGGIAAAWDETLFEAVRSGLSERVLPGMAESTRVEPARFGDSAALLGLAALARSRE